VEKITDAMYGVVNETGGTGGQLRLAGIEFQREVPARRR